MLNNNIYNVMYIMLFVYIFLLLFICNVYISRMLYKCYNKNDDKSLYILYIQ